MRKIILFLIVSMMTMAGCAKTNIVRLIPPEDIAKQQIEDIIANKDYSDAEKAQMIQMKMAEDLERKKRAVEAEKDDKLASIINKPVTPMRTPDTILRVLVLPYENSDGVLNSWKYSYIKVQDGSWILSDYLNGSYKSNRGTLVPLEAEGAYNVKGGFNVGAKAPLLNGSENYYNGSPYIKPNDEAVTKESVNQNKKTAQQDNIDKDNINTEKKNNKLKNEKKSSKIKETNNDENKYIEDTPKELKKNNESNINNNLDTSRNKDIDVSMDKTDSKNIDDVKNDNVKQLEKLNDDNKQSDSNDASLNNQSAGNNSNSEVVEKESKKDFIASDEEGDINNRTEDAVLLHNNDNKSDIKEIKSNDLSIKQKDTTEDNVNHTATSNDINNQEKGVNNEKDNIVTQNIKNPEIDERNASQELELSKQENKQSNTKVTHQNISTDSVEDNKETGQKQKEQTLQVNENEQLSTNQNDIINSKNINDKNEITNNTDNRNSVDAQNNSFKQNNSNIQNRTTPWNSPDERFREEGFTIKLQ